MSDSRGRELLGGALWAVAALAWTAAMVVPWFRAGALAHVSPVELAGALRTGLLGLPAVVGYAVLLLPAASWLLLALAPVRGRRALVVRALLWLASTALALALLVLGASVSAGTYGTGAALVALACVTGGVALARGTR